MRTVARRMIGEDAQPGAVAADETATAAPSPAPLTPGQSIPVETLVALWERGEKEAAAVRVLDALDSYGQFVEFCFRIGREGALELGQIMDELTANELSPHALDTTADTDLAAKYSSHGPKPGPETHAAFGESVGKRMIGS